MLDPKFCTSPTIADQPVWLKLDLDSAVTFSSYDIWAGTYFGQNPKHWSVACEASPPPTPQPTHLPTQDSGSASGSSVYVDQELSRTDAREYCRTHH